MTKEEKQKLSKEEIYKLFDKGQIDFKEFDELRKALPSYEQEKLNSMLRRKKKAEIKALYFKGELSISDTLAYEQIILLDKNRSNTSSIVWIIVVNIVLVVLGVMFMAS